MEVGLVGGGDDVEELVWKGSVEPGKVVTVVVHDDHEV